MRLLLQASDSGPSSAPNQDLNNLKQRLAMAVQQSAGSPAKPATRSQSSDAHDSLMEELLALPPPQHSRCDFPPWA